MTTFNLAGRVLWYFRRTNHQNLRIQTFLNISYAFNDNIFSRPHVFELKDLSENKLLSVCTWHALWILENVQLYVFQLFFIEVSAFQSPNNCFHEQTCCKKLIKFLSFTRCNENFWNHKSSCAMCIQTLL